MAELEIRLRALLAERYAIEREIGQGGMAKVFLARDLQHGRRVAIKVFLPEVAAAFGPGRFVREIRTAANLNHPNILALYDSGEGDGLLYYVMPYVEGESLAQRIEREGQLSIPDALAITRQVATALEYAHTRGIVHRDIKPGNILLAGGNAYIADFGIAHALEETGGEKLTSTGFALGTPTYMSPEQSGGYGQIDGRADLYSLGCVLYEMLVGEPPFSGRSAQAVLARHSVERVPSARAVRDTVPWAVEQAIYKALAKSPADRFGSGGEFARALEPERLSQQVPVTRPWLRPAAIGLLAAILALGAIGGALALWSGRDSARHVAASADRVAVLPFSAVGGADSGLTRLASGLADLTVQRLPGDGGPRALTPGTVMAEIQKVAPRASAALTEATALRVAAGVGAGLLLTGEVGRSGPVVTVNATLSRVPGGAVLARVENLSAPPDSLGLLLDRVVSSLLANGFAPAGTLRYGLAELPLPMVRKFLAAREAFVRGEFLTAGKNYRAVLRADSTFAPAALGLASYGRLAPDSEAVFYGVTRAMAVRNRLSESDSLYLLALAGREWPRPPSIPERIALWNRLLEVAPELIEGWYLLGEVLFHDGPFNGTPDLLRQARAAFEHALEQEPRFVPALSHVLDLAASDGDTAVVRKLGPRFLAIDSTGELADYYRWRVALALGDAKALQNVRARIDAFNSVALDRIVNVSQLDGVALEDGRRAAQTLWSRAGEQSEIRWRFVKLRELALNRGRPAEAAGITRRRMASIPLRPRDRLSEVADALFWEADTILASELVRERGPSVDGLSTTWANTPDSVHYDVCAVNLWRVSRGEYARVPGAIRRLESVPQSSDDYTQLCAQILNAQLTAGLGRRDARVQLEVLDSIARTAPPTITWIVAAASLTAARLWERAGDLNRALAATRRRPYITDKGERRVLVALSTFLREEGRLAALTGDRDGAIRAYRKYLALRADPEPALAPEVARIRAQLDSLERR